MNSINKIEQGRAEAAFKAVKRRTMDENAKKENYKSYSKKIPMLIKTNGLAATFAFINTNEKDDASVLLGRDIIEWLVVLNPEINQYLENTGNKLDAFINYLLSIPMITYRLITREILAYMNWHRRFTEGMIKVQQNG